MIHGTSFTRMEMPPLTFEAIEAAVERLEAEIPKPDRRFFEIPVCPAIFDDQEKLRAFGERVCDWGPKGAVYTFCRDETGLGSDPFLRRRR